MAEFSIVKALQNLLLDPFPTTHFREIVKQLNQVKTLIQETTASPMCSVGEVLKKVDVAPPPASKNRILPSVEVQKMLSTAEMSPKFVDLVTQLLRYLLVKLDKCCSDEAHSILCDFHDLKDLVLAFRDSGLLDTKHLDHVIAMFLDKLIRMVKQLNRENKDLQLHLFAVMRVMILELGKHPVYALIIARRVGEEIKAYYESQDGEEYAFEAYFTHLYILNELMGKDLAAEAKRCDDSLLSDLKRVLSEDRSRPREVYLIQNVLRVIDVYLNV